MSLDAQNAAWATGLKSGPKIVLISLSDNANDSGELWVRAEYIAQRCGMDERNVRRHITQLHALGYLTIQHRTGHSSRYYVHVSDLGEPLLAPERYTPDKLSGVEREKLAERIAAENIAAMQEKRMAAKEARRRAEASATAKRAGRPGSDDKSTPDKLPGVNGKGTGALDAWNRVHQHLRGGYRNGALGEERIDGIVQGLGGYAQLARLSETDLHFKRISFMKAWKESQP